MAELVPIGTANVIVDFTIAANEVKRISLLAANAPNYSAGVQWFIHIKSSNGKYSPIDELNSSRIGRRMDTPGDYGVERRPTGEASGIDLS